MRTIVFTKHSKKVINDYSDSVKTKFLSALRGLNNRNNLKQIKGRSLYTLAVGEYRIILAKNADYLIVLDIITKINLLDALNRIK